MSLLLYMWGAISNNQSGLISVTVLAYSLLVSTSSWYTIHRGGFCSAVQAPSHVANHPHRQQMHTLMLVDIAKQLIHAAPATNAYTDAS